MSNDIKIGINVSDGGTTAKANKEAEILHKTLKGAAKAASEINVPTAVAAARKGVEASNAMRSPSPAKATRAPGNINSEELKDYGTSRGIAGVTGAASRDFAKQAQGLGGLVHVYATFAANLFAVSAAFSALSKAADTSNMVKGLDQLGAVSGKSLGSLAKQLSQVTDGAISMRDAMTATVSASAGGMTNAAILRMGVVAKQASQALGVAMPDALNRISRGITKLEPELLDEIGIMVRVDTASQAYARTLGKTASSLTDFEKRQGFANAVLEQGEKKFGAIKLDTNPYDKILASMQNIAQTGLELVNKVLGPLLSLLSSSPTALAISMGSIAAILLNQAIPALSAWRENLNNTALMAEKSAKHIKDSFLDFKIQKGLLPGLQLEKEANTFKAVAYDIIKTNKLFKESSDISKTASSETGVFSAKNLSSVKASITSVNSEIAKTAELTKQANNPAELTRLEAETKALVAKRAALISLSSAVSTSMQKSKQKEEALDKFSEGFDKPTKYFEELAQRERKAKSAEQKASSSLVLSQVGKNTEFMGVKDAFSQMWSDVTKGVKDETGKKLTEPLEGIRKYSTAASGAVRILGSGLMTLVSSLGTAGMVISVLAGAFAVLNSWLSTNSKEAEKFSNSLIGLNDSVDNMSRTLDVIATKDPLSVFSIETIQARANALQGLSDTLASLTKDFNDVQKASSWWDNGIDALWDAVGKGSADKLSTNVAKSIAAGLAGAATDAARSEAIVKLQKILGANIDVTNVKQVTEELRKLNNPEISAAVAEVGKVLRDVSLSANNAATDLASATTRLTELGTLIQTQNLALMPTDAIGKLGTSMLSAALDMSKALKDPVNSMLTLNKLLEDSKTLSILSPSVSTELISANSDIKELNASYSKLQSDLAKGEKELADLKSQGKAEYKVGDLKKGSNERVKVAEDTEAGALAKESVARIKMAMVEAETKMSAVSTELSAKVANDFVNIGLSKLNSSLKVAMSEGAATAAKGYLSVLKEAGVGTAEAEAKLAQQELGIQKQVLDATYNQIKVQQQNTNAIELNNIGQRLIARSMELATADTPRKMDNILSKYEGLDKELATAIEKAKVTNMDPKQALALRAGGDISTEVLAGMAPYMSAISGYLAGQAKLNGASAATKIIGFANIEKQTTAAAQKKNTAEISTITTDLAEVNNAIALSAEYDKSLALKKNTLETTKRTLEYDNDQLKIASDLRIIEEARKTGAISQEKVEEAVAEAEKARLDRAKKFSSETMLAQAESLKTELKGLEDIRQKEQSNLDLVRNEIQAIYALKLTQQSDELNFLASIGVLTAEAASKAQTEISLKQQSLAFDKQITEEANKYVTAFTDLENKKLLAGTNNAAVAAFQKDQDNLVASYLRQAEATSLSNKYKVEGITLAGEQDSLAKSHTDQMEKMLSVTESLSTIFGDLGTNIGLAGQALLKMSQDDEKYLKNKTLLEDKLLDAIEKKDPKAEAAALKSLTTLDKNRAKEEVGNIGKIAEASKKMFSEKTAAYKILDGIEKTMAAYKMAMQIKDVAMDLKNFAIKIGLLQAEVPVVAATTAAKTGIEIAGQAATMPAKIAGVYASFMSMLGPFGPPAAALAIAALIGSFAGGDGGTTVNTAGLTAEDQQKSQGTGQKWVDGKLVDTGGGVFEDSEAKSNSLLNSIDLIKDNQIEGLSYDNKSLSILESIDKGIEKTAIALYQTQGISIGSGFGTNEVSTSSPGFLGLFASSNSTEIVNSGIKLGGTLANVTAQQFEDVLKTKTSSGFLGFGGGTSTSLTKNIKDLDSKATAGLQEIFDNMGELFVSQGTQLGRDAAEVEAILATIPLNVTASLKGLKGKELREELGYVLSGIQDDTTNKLFPTLRKFRQFGEGMGETVTRVLDSNEKFKLSLTSIGVAIGVVKDVVVPVSQLLIDNVATAQAKVDALKVDKRTVSKKVPGIWDTGYPTESIVDPQIAIDLALANTELSSAQLLVIEATGAMTTNSLDLSEALIQNAGGLEQYLENIKFFGDNFLTEAQRLKPIAVSVKTSMEDMSKPVKVFSGLLGLFGGAQAKYNTYAQDLFKTISDGGDSIINTREEFSRLYTENLAVAASSGENALAAQTLVTALDTVAPSYLRIVEAEERTRDLREELMAAEGRGVEVVALQRGRELAALSDTDAAIQARIWKLEDESAAATKLAGFDAAGLGGMMLDAAFNPQEGYTSAQSFGAALNKSIRNTLISNTINTVAESLFKGIITPILLGQTVSETTTDALIADAISKSDRLASILGDPKFAQAIASIATTVGTVIDRLGSAAQSAGSLNVQSPNVTSNNVAATAGREPNLPPNSFISPTTGNIVTWDAKGVHTDTGNKPLYSPLTPSTSQQMSYSSGVSTGGYTGYDQATNATSTTDTAIKKAEELSKAKLSLDIEILNALGKSNEALMLTRAEELRLIDPTLVEKKKELHLIQDKNKTNTLNIELLTAEGRLHEVLLITREKELLALSNSDKLIKTQTYAAQDLNKTNELQYTLMILQGKGLEVVKLRREKELLTLSATDKALKARIWMLEDEKAAATAINSQQVTLLGLLGMSEKALALTRATELENMEDSLRPRQKYIYALQDEQAIREKLKTALKSNSDNLKGFIKTLKETRDSMLLGAQTTLTPEQRYQEAKSQKDAIAKAAVAIAVTDSEIATRNDAISKLPSATGAFLEASRELYASSAQYTQDFNSVLDLLDTTSNNLIEQATVADNQLNKLESIATSSDSIEGLTEQLLGAQQATTAALAAYKDSGTGTGTQGETTVSTEPISRAIESMYTGILGRASDAEGKAFWVDKVKTGTSLTEIEKFFRDTPEAKVQVLYNKLAGRMGEAEGVKYWSDLLKEGAPKEEVLRSFANSVVSIQGENASKLARDILSGTATSVPGFANGGIASGVAVVGERGPELVDFATPSRVYSNKASNDLLNNRELIAEIRNLRKEVAELRADQREQTGHLIASNYDANSANAKEIAKATEEAAQAQIWSERSKVKLA